jgi:molecular chaperone DnaK
LKDSEGKIPAELKDEVNKKISAVKEVKEGTDGEAIKKATEELSNEMSKIGEAMSKAGTETPPASAPEEQNAEVKDAEFKEKGGEGEEPKA